jgi:hypothetical protein
LEELEDERRGLFAIVAEREEAEKAREGGGRKGGDQRRIALKITVKALHKGVRIGVDSTENGREPLDKVGQTTMERFRWRAPDELRDIIDASGTKKVEFCEEVKPEEGSRTGNGAVS